MKTFYIEEVESTNLYAKSHVEDFADGTVVHASIQNSGRGRLQRSWVDFGKGNLFMTFVLKPSDSFDEKYSNLTQYLSVVLCKLLEKYGLEPQIKWPNDVLINGKKIAGILAETVMSGGNLKGLVLGIGVNLSATQEQVNSIQDKLVTSLNLELGHAIDLDEFRDELCEMFFENYERFLNQGFEMIKSDYISKACFLDKEICVKVFNDEKRGIAKSVTDKGELLLSHDDKDFVLTIGDIL